MSETHKRHHLLIACGRQKDLGRGKKGGRDCGEGGKEEGMERGVKGEGGRQTKREKEGKVLMGVREREAGSEEGEK